jgi:phage virion morphogenesis protein
VITITVENPDLAARLRALQAKGANLRVVLDEIGENLIESTQKRISSQTDPDGNRWRAVKSKYAARKTAGKATRDPSDARSRDPKQILFLTGKLKDGINRQAVPGGVSIGSNEKYAATHQFGRTAIPARPFLGFSASDKAMIMALLDEHLDEDGV